MKTFTLFVILDDELDTRISKLKIDLSNFEKKKFLTNWHSRKGVTRGWERSQFTTITVGRYIGNCNFVIKVFMMRNTWERSHLFPVYRVMIHQ